MKRCYQARVSSGHGTSCFGWWMRRRAAWLASISESRVWDVQALVRRTRGRERDGNVDHILIVLAYTAHNRRVANELRTLLGPDYPSGQRRILAALRRGERLPGSGVVLL
jgi:hypothetical protein